MSLKVNSTAFGVKVAIAVSGETGTVTGYCQHMRGKTKMFFVEYRGNDGCCRDGWFHEDQLSEI